MQSKLKKNRSGRPPKFHEPRHPVTMTLPVRILDQLAEIDPDRTCAVVKITEAVVGNAEGYFKPVELVEMAPGKSLIVIGPSKTWKKIPGLKLIEISPARYLLTITSGMSIEALEVTLRDLLHHLESKKNEPENPILLELLNLLGQKRRAQHLSKAEILIVESNRSAGVSTIPAKV